VSERDDLLVKQRISEALIRYCRAMDRVDVELAREVWHADGIADYRPTYYGLGRDFAEWICELHRTQMLSHMHRISNVLIVVAGERARSECYITAIMRRTGREHVVQTTYWGRYLDEWSPREDRWAIDRRRYIHEFDETRQIDLALSQGRPATLTTRDRGDPSYDLDLG
jgi:hypothetical protein